ncbi:DUF2207 domain-containing protein [Marisediminicola antarctica]|nr:DUF2207 domain-containing protein [Marisediminicola antarctica]
MRRLLTTTLIMASMLAGPAISAVAALGPAGGPAGAASSSARSATGVQDFTFTSYEADYYLSRAEDRTSRLTTVETFVAEFPEFDQNRGIIRSIPLDYDGVPLAPSIESVVDDDGDPVPYQESEIGGFLELALGTDDYVRGTQTYTISYSQINVVRSFADTSSDEFYWDTNGTGFAQPFGRLTARVHVAPAIAGETTGEAACYVGVRGSTDRCDLAVMPDPDAPGAKLFTAGAENLGPGENVSVAIAFSPGTFVVPEPPQPSNLAIWASGVVMVLAMLGSIVAIVARIAGPRDARGRGTIIAQYSVPDGVYLLLAGDIVKRSSTSMAAQFVSLAVRGNLRIIERGDDFALQFLHDRDLDAQETEVMEALFGRTPDSAQERSLTKPSQKLATKLSSIRTASRKLAVSAGLRERVRARVRWVILAALAGIVALAAVVVFLDLVLSPVPTGWAFAALLISGFGLFIGGLCAIRPAVLTDTGADLRDYISGLRVYLTLAEADRFRVLQSPAGAVRVDVGNHRQIVKLYEKLLPWAVLWGVEKEWAQELAVQYADETPDWYVGSSPFTGAHFAGAMTGFRSAATSASAPASSASGSSSGGSSGGGFSGGGGGGGGGGGR